MFIVELREQSIYYDKYICLLIRDGTCFFSWRTLQTFYNINSVRKVLILLVLLRDKTLLRLLYLYKRVFRSCKVLPLHLFHLSFLVQLSTYLFRPLPLLYSPQLYIDSLHVFLIKLKRTLSFDRDRLQGTLYSQRYSNFLSSQTSYQLISKRFYKKRLQILLSRRKFLSS